MGSIKNMTFDFTDPANPILEFSSYPGAGNNRMLKEISFAVTKKNIQVGAQIAPPPVFLTPLVANSNIINSIYTGSTSASTQQSATNYSYALYDSFATDSIIHSSITGNTWVKISGFAGNSTTFYTKTRINLSTLYGAAFETNKQYAFDVRLTETTDGFNTVNTWSWNSQTTPTLLPSNVDNYTTYVNGNTSDITLPAAPAEGADWGYQAVTPTGGTALVVTRILASEIAAAGGTIKAVIKDTSGSDVIVPASTTAMLLYASNSTLVQPGGSVPDYYTSPSLDTTNFGGLGGNTLITVNNISTAPNSYITVGFAIPVGASRTASTLAYGETYNFMIQDPNNNSNVLVQTGLAVLACLYEDSEVLTPSGYVSVKQLQNGDLVTTSDGRTSRIVNIMKSKMPATENTSPIIIPANSIAENYPPKDCRISKYHMIQYNGNWIAPLKNKHIFKADKSIKSIRYYHIQLENYYADHLVINGGLIVESLGNGERDNTAEWDARVNNSIIL